HSRARTEHAAGTQIVEVRETLSGESVEQVGLGGADAGRGSLGAGGQERGGRSRRSSYGQRITDRPSRRAPGFSRG
ncbi:hypothetical protein ACWCQ6_37215, partial [Streptomyces sp. NPDC001880]